MASIFLYDAETYEELRFIEPPEHEMISLAALSPDGHTIASMNVTYGDVRIWDADTGTTKYIIEIDHSYKGFSGFLDTIVFSPDGRFLASGGCAQDTRLYDVESGELVRTFPGQTQGLAFSQDGEQLISIGCQGNPFPSSPMTTWEVDSGRLISSINRPNRTAPGDISISPDGQLFAVNSGNEVALLDAKLGVTRNRMTLEEGAISRMAFSPDGRTIATFGRVSQGGKTQIKLWNVETGELLKTVNEWMAGGSLLFSPGGNKLAGAGLDVYILDVNDDKLPTKFGEFRAYNHVVFLLDGKTLLTGGGYPGVKAWSMDTGNKVSFNLEEDIDGWVASIRPDGYKLLEHNYNQGNQRYYSVWNVETGKELSTLEVEFGNPRHTVFSPDGERVALAEFWKDGQWHDDINVWDIYSGKHLFTLPHRGISSMAFSPDGTILATGGSRTVKLIDASTGEIVEEVYQPSEIRHIAFSQDGKVLASAGISEIQLWDMISYQQLHRLAIGANWVAFSPGDRQLASIGYIEEKGERKCTTYLWDINTGELIWPEKRRSIAYASGCLVYFGPSGELIFASEKGSGVTQILSADTGELLWSYPTNLPWRGSNVFNISPDGRLFAIVGQDGTVRVFGVNP
jgi:WD40 repeat protein